MKRGLKNLGNSWKGRENDFKTKSKALRTLLLLMQVCPSLARRQRPLRTTLLDVIADLPVLLN